MSDDTDTDDDGGDGSGYVETRTIAHGKYATFDDGTSVEVNKVDDRTGAWVYGDTIQKGHILQPEQTTIVGDLDTDAKVALSPTDGGLVATVCVGDGIDVYAQHMRGRGGVPELNPPAEPNGPHNSKPRALDRDLDADDAEKIADLLWGYPASYAITFPESEAPTTYIRAGVSMSEIAEGFEDDGPFVGVRRSETAPGWNERQYEREGVLRRMRRERATRLVYRDDAPNALYPEHYHTDPDVDQ